MKHGQQNVVLEHCTVCDYETKHYKKSGDCKICRIRESDYRRAEDMLLKLKGVTIECNFQGCNTRIQATLLQQRKFCALRHTIPCDVCKELFSSPSKSHKKTCSTECQTSYTAKQWLEKYGVTNPSKLDSIKEKIKSSIKSNHGGVYPGYSQEFQERNLKKYGVRFHTQAPEIIEKIRKSYVENHGGYWLASPKIRAQVEETMLKTYGVRNISQAPDWPVRFREGLKKKYGTEYPVFNNQRSTSKVEIECRDWIRSVYAKDVYTDRELLKGREIDIYLPDLKLGIEFNGTYWHRDSESIKKLIKHLPSERQRWKQEQTTKLGVELIFVWEHDWMNNRELTQLRIKNIIAAKAITNS